MSGNMLHLSSNATPLSPDVTPSHLILLLSPDVHVHVTPSPGVLVHALTWSYTFRVMSLYMLHLSPDVPPLTWSDTPHLMSLYM